jgi:hypothetical protein
VELIRKDKEKFRSARKIPPSGKPALIASSSKRRFCQRGRQIAGGGGWIKNCVCISLL